MEIACLLACSAAVSASQLATTSEDMPGRFLPGKYFQYKAQIYLKKKDYAISLEMSKLASYWADKTAQYNVGILYFTGTGIAQDKVRGVAWLHIAAEHKSPVAVHALELADAELTPQQRLEAVAIWHELDLTYDDAVTLRRAKAHFDAEKRNVTGSRVGFVGALHITDASGSYTGDQYYAKQQRDFDTFVEDNFGHGHVDIGAIEPVTN
ncbi:sel1 repeat family protein [Pseudolysobacter antarcticus]|uniref:Sel1 repeat family protein n=1 Tax=Pseudolysobacter antarcticus TaxID=2511995 RepID=A0A411HF13_9GAMM|nr:sel1 repeat family protein [Pseudolysobacter antarcticus]QBB69076.1 sel1 repeat family protein [Pseudolysobacter antarcticus]